MATKYFALLTERGAAKLAAATALGTQVKLTQMAVGDGGGSLPVPTATQTALIGEKRRAALNSLTVDPANASQIIAEQVIPESEGGFWIREIGVFDDTGELIAIANCAETYKPVLAEGSGRTQVIRMVLIVSSTDAVTLKIDPSVVLATRKYVDDQTIIVKAYADDLMAKHLAAADPHTQYATKASPTLTGTPKAPTAATSTNTTQIATTAFVQAVIAQLVASSPAALDTLNELAAALGNDPNFATTVTNALALKAPLASPGLTGTPTAPTAAATANTTQIATTAFVQAVITALKAGAPAALDTLDELAAAINDDPNFATTISDALALKAPLASPAMTGTPTAPTAASTANNTQLATTAFVKTAIANLVASAPGALDTLNELAAALGNDANFAATMTNALALKAQLASPALTGTPTAPTASAGTATDQIATMNALLNGMALYGIGGAGATVPTYTIHPADIANTSPTRIIQALNTEDQTTVGSPVANQSFGGLSVIRGIRPAQFGVSGQGAAATFWYRGFSGALALQSDWLQLATTLSPTFTGTPTAPTAAVGTNTAQLATTAFVASTLSYLGYGTAPATRAALDWQNDTFDIGQAFAVNGANITNIPAGMDSPGTLNVNINVRSGDSSTTRIIDVVYSTVTAAGYRKYEVRLAGNVGSRNILARQVFTSADTLPLASGGTGDKTAEGAIQNLLVRENLTGIVGATVNAKMTIATASATGTFTADEIIVAESLAGRQFRLTAFSKTLNLAATGANGMDTGTAPTSGFVALYAIYNPTTATSAVVAVNATTSAVPEIYGGANMPSGYTASALLCVVPTDSTGKIVPLLQMGRKTLIATAQLSSTTAFISTPTALNISATVPKNAKFLDGILYLVSGNSTRPVISVQPLSSPAVGIKQVVGGNSTGVNNTQAPFSDLAISTAQTIYWQVSAGVAGDTISSAFTYATGYSI